MIRCHTAMQDKIKCWCREVIVEGSGREETIAMLQAEREIDILQSVSSLCSF